MDEVEHILFFATNNTEASPCDYFSFAHLLHSNVTVDNRTYQAIVYSNITSVLAGKNVDDLKYQLLTIHLLDDNTLNVGLESVESPGTLTSSEALKLAKIPEGETTAAASSLR